MPYKFGGRLSAGCEKCRQKRVKCDEAKPRCSKCSKSDNPCNYRDFGELLFRDETKDTALRAQRQWRSRVIIDGYDSDKTSESGLSRWSKSETLDESDWSFASDQGLDQEISASPPQAIVEPVASQARTRFFYDFVFPGDPKTFRASYLDFVPKMLEDSTVDSALPLAVDALSLANFSKRRSSPGTCGKAMWVYGQAMNATNAAIADPVLSVSFPEWGSEYLLSLRRCTQNSTLAACGLLTMFELLCGPFGYLEHYQSHSDGCMALLKHRGYDDFSTAQDLAVFRFVYGSEVIRCLKWGRRPIMPAVRTDLRRLFPFAQGQLLSMMSEASNLTADFLEARKAGRLNEVATAILRKSRVLDATLMSWHRAQPPWFMASVSFVENEKLSPWLTGLLSSEDAPARFHRHYNSTVGNLTGFYQIARLRTQQLIARTALVLDDQEGFSTSLTEIAAIVEYICCSVGSFFNDAVGLKEGGHENEWETQGIRTHIGFRSFIMPAYKAMKTPWVAGTPVQEYLPFLQRVLDDFRELWQLWAPNIDDILAS